MNKVLLIKPDYSAVPVGFAYVLASLKEHAIPFDFVDTTIDVRNYRSMIKKNDYLAVASGGLISQFGFFCEVTKEVRKYRPDTPMILGGDITKDIRPDFLFDKIGIDYGILGEAETSFPFLLKALAEKREDISQISGILYRDKKGVIVKNRPVRFDLQSYNFLPAWDCIDVDYYSKGILPYYGFRSSMPILSGRGCVGRCSFCSPTVGSFRRRPLQHIAQEIEFLNANYDFEWFNFYNEMFYTSKEEILEFCEVYKKINPRKPWVCALRVDAKVDTETFRAMKDAGCASTSAGIESGSDKVLKLMHKNTTRERTTNFFRMVKEAGLPCNGTFMVCSEGENDAELKETFDMIIQEEMNAGESLTLTYPGTGIYRNALKRGLIPDEWEYLQRLKYFGVGTHSWKDRSHYLNISDIPNERLWETLVSHTSRFHTFLHQRFQVKEIEYKTFGSIGLGVRGICPQCGNKVAIPFPENILSLVTNCRFCFYRVYFDLYQLPKHRNHFENLLQAIKRARRVVIWGTNSEAADLLQINIFGLERSKIVGFIDPDEKGLINASFICKPRFSVEDMVSLSPDLILIAEDRCGVAELHIGRLYAEDGKKSPQTLRILPDPMLGFAVMICRLVQRLNLPARVQCGIVSLAKIASVPRVSLMRALSKLNRAHQIGFKNTLKKTIIRVRRRWH